MDNINEEHEPTDPHETDPVSDEVEASNDTVEDDAPASNDTVQDSAVEDDTIEADTPVDESPLGDATTIPPIPPAPQQVPQYDRLTRDPFATLGGVLSGIAHRYGWDVALTRLAFVVLLLVSGGTAIFAYLLAWLIIPRATHWPPARVSSGRSRLSGRDLGIGLIGLGAIIVLGIGSGEASAVLVPLAMVGGGMWLLFQNPREEELVSPASGSYATTATHDAPIMPTQTPSAMPPQAPSIHGAATLAQGVPPQPTIAPVPVPKRSRLRRLGIIGVIGILGLLLLVLIGVPLLVIALLTDGDFEFSEAKYHDRPATIAEIDHVINEDVGEITLDLRDVDFDSITASDEPVPIDIDLNAGRIEVILPEGVRASIQADTDIGEVTVLGSTDDGINPSRTFIVDDPQLDIDLDVDFGEIVVERRNSSASTVEVD